MVDVTDVKAESVCREVNYESACSVLETLVN